MCGAKAWNMVGSRWPPVGVMACPAGTTRGPSTQPRSMAFLRATSSSSPPVCTNRPRLRTVVNPARRVRRALATARSVRRAGSSCTAMSGLRWSGPPRSRLTSMSISPGSSVRSPRSIVHRVVGHRGRGHLEDALAPDQQVAGGRPARPGRRRACGRCAGGWCAGVRGRAMGCSFGLVRKSGCHENQYMIAELRESEYRSKAARLVAGPGEVGWHDELGTAMLRLERSGPDRVVRDRPARRRGTH